VTRIRVPPRIEGVVCRGGPLGQGALFARRIQDAIGLSARHLFTETGEPAGSVPNPSLSNTRRCGFVKVVSRLNLANPSVTTETGRESGRCRSRRKHS
jgi:hypothetical protein